MRFGYFLELHSFNNLASLLSGDDSAPLKRKMLDIIKEAFIMERLEQNKKTVKS